MIRTTNRCSITARSPGWDRLEIGGVGAEAVFLRLFSDRGWTRGLDCEVGENRG
jgi:hypothetical protein